MKEYLEAIRKRYPKYRLDTRFNAGAAREELEKLAETIHMILPQAFCDMYEQFNGEKEYLGSMLEFALMSLDKIRSEIMYLRNIPGKIPCEPAEFVREDGYLKGWIPFADDADGSFIIIDMNPDSLGKVGQVIAFDCREWKTFVLADSLEAFLKKLTEKVNEKEITLTKQGVLSWEHGYHFEKFNT